MAVKETPAIERLWRHIEPEPMSGCWLWTGAHYSRGYGVVRLARRTVSAHRLMYKLSGNTIADDLELDHLCRVRSCVNPRHLEPVTHQENCDRVLAWPNALKTHCPQGHAYTAENTKPMVYGGRGCRECHRADGRRYYYAYLKERRKSHKGSN